MDNAIAVVSGGMDSTTLAYWMRYEGYTLHLMTFDYGQRHRKELDYACETAARLDAPIDVVDLSELTTVLSGSALTDPSIPVPDGHYGDVSMRFTVVPNRNMIMLAVAVGKAVSCGATCVAIGVHAGDHPVYPDCRPGFIRAMDVACFFGTEGYAHPELRIYAPFVDKTKDQIVRIGHELGVPFENTWSCYKGGAVHCGTCGTCVERREAFAVADIHDPTIYLGENLL